MYNMAIFSESSNFTAICFYDSLHVVQVELTKIKIMGEILIVKFAFLLQVI